MRKFFALAAAVSLPCLAACDPENDSSSSTEESTSTGTSTDTDAQSNSNTTRSGADPCEDKGFADETPVQECDVVAWVDLNQDDIGEPIAVVWFGGPEVALSTIVDGEEHIYRAGQMPGTREPYLGPDLSTQESTRYHTFAGAFEMTNDETPEVVMWIDKAGNADTFRVLRFTETGFEPIESPDRGRFAGGDNWASLFNSEVPSYRCTEDGESPLESINSSSAGLQAAKLSYDRSTHEFSRGEFSPTGSIKLDQENMPLGIDCNDLSDRDPAPAELISGPGTRCPLGDSSGFLPGLNKVFYFEAIVSKGDLNCKDVETMWDEYFESQNDRQAGGKAQIVNFGDHTCSFPPDAGTDSALSQPGCTALDDSWSFNVDSR